MIFGQNSHFTWWKEGEIYLIVRHDARPGDDEYSVTLLIGQLEPLLTNVFFLKDEQDNRLWDRSVLWVKSLPGITEDQLDQIKADPLPWFIEGML